MENSTKTDQQIEKNRNNPGKFKFTMDDWRSSNYLRYQN